MWVKSGFVLLFIAGNMFKEGNCRSRLDDPVSQAACSPDQCSDKPCRTNCPRTPREIRAEPGNKPDAPVPPPPRNLMFKEGTQTLTSFTVEWDLPDTPLRVTAYGVTLTSNPWHHGISHSIRTPPDVRTAEFQTLDPGQFYEITVKTILGDVYSPPASLYFTSAPLPVENLAPVINIYGGLDEVSWDPSRSSTQDSYKISYYAVERQADVPKSLIVNRTKVTLNDLLPGWNYSISIQAISNKSESTESMIHLVTPPAHPTSMNLELVEEGFNVSWKTDAKSRQDEFGIGYQIESVNDRVWRLPVSAFTNKSYFHLTHLYPGKLYHIEVTAFSCGKQSGPNYMTQHVVPHSPRNVSIEKVWSNGVSIRWEMPQNSLFTAFTIRYKTGKDKWWRQLLRLKDSTNAEIHDLTPGELYIIEIYAYINQVESLNKPRFNQTIPPAPVLNMIVTRIPTIVALEWLRPEGRIETYLIEWWQVKNRTDIQTKNVTEKNVSAVGMKEASRNRRELIIGDLIPGVEYSFSIYTASHDSSSTVASLQTTIEPTAGDGLDAVVTSDVRNTSSIHVTWDRPESFPDFYIVNITLNDSQSDDPLFHNVSGTATETIFSDVEILEGFIVYVRAWTSDVGGLIISKRFESLPTSIRRADFVIPLCLAGGIAVVMGIRIAVYAYLRLQKRRLQSQNQQLDEYEMSPERLTITRVLGNGAFGIVKLGSLRDDQGNVTNVAVKMLRDDSNENDLRSFLDEIELMKALDKHRNIVSLVGCSTIGPYPFLVVEYCSRGDLYSFLRKTLEEGTSLMEEARKCTVISNIWPKRKEIRKENCENSSKCRIDDDYVQVSYSAEHQDTKCDPDIITVLDMLNFGRQIATGMVFLSSNRIVHRDLATRNVLVCYDRTMKISDFGLSRDIYQENCYKKSGTGRMPLKWMAIEALTHQAYSTCSDVWSFGILLWEIVTLGGIPYPGVPTLELPKRLQSGYRMERPENCSIPLYDVMLSCWQTRPRDRPTFTMLCQELEKLISVTTENQYFDLNDVSEQVLPEPSSPRLQNIA